MSVLSGACYASFDIFGHAKRANDPPCVNETLTGAYPFLRACLVSERVRVTLDASVPEKALGTDLSDGPPVFGRFSVAQRRLAREV